jgi:hypothetical protein
MTRLSGFLFLALTACVSTQDVVSDSSFGKHLSLSLPAPYVADDLGITTTTVETESVRRESTRIASGDDAALRALEALRFRLLEQGFEVVERAEAADAIAELTVVGLTPAGGAERASVVFRDARSGRTLAMFRARNRLGGSVERLIDSLAEAIARRT